MKEKERKFKERVYDNIKNYLKICVSFFQSNRGYMTLSPTRVLMEKVGYMTIASKAGYVTKPKSGLGAKELAKKLGR